MEKRQINISFIVLVLLVATSTMAEYSSAQHFLWQDRFRPDGGFAQIQAVAARGEYVVAVGADSSAAGVEGLVRAYLATTGELLWQDRIDKAGKESFLNAVVMSSQRPFVGGYWTDSTRNRNLFVRAYDLQTGTLEWEDLYDGAGRRDEVSFHTMALDGDRVYAGGLTQSKTGSSDWLVRAYNARNGSLLWQDAFDGGNFDHTIWLNANDTYVVSSGVTTDSDTIRHFTVRTYDAATGNLLWQDNPRGRKGYFFDSDVAWQAFLRDDKVIAAGSIGDSAAIRMAVRAYDAKNGALIWKDLVNKGAGSDVAFSLAPAGDRVIVAGSGGPDCDSHAESNCDAILRAYDLRSGTLVWERLDDKFGRDDGWSDVVVAGDLVVAVGGYSDSSHVSHWAVDILETGDGKMVWGDYLNEPGGTGFATDVEVSEGRACVAGIVEDASGKGFWLLRVYDLKQ